MFRLKAVLKKISSLGTPLTAVHFAVTVVAKTNADESKASLTQLITIFIIEL